MNTRADLAKMVLDNTDAGFIVDDIASTLHISLNYNASVEVNGELYHGMFHLCKYFNVMKKLGLGAELVKKNAETLHKPIHYITRKGEEVYKQLKKEGYYG